MNQRDAGFFQGLHPGQREVGFLFVKDVEAELSVGEGETITADFFESGWAWASRESGESGWIPLSHLAPDLSPNTPYQISASDQARMLRRVIKALIVSIEVPWS